MSRCLAERSIDHVLLERGEVAHSWRTERWDSLRLLTPNWQSRLPGFRYDGNDPDGYRTMPEVIDDRRRASDSVHFAAAMDLLLDEGIRCCPAGKSLSQPVQDIGLSDRICWGCRAHS